MMTSRVFVFLILYISASVSERVDSETINRILQRSDVVKNVVKKKGYPFETHLIFSADGHILTYHRVKHGKQDKPAHRQPILMVHGILQSSGYFLGIDDSLAYQLADAGFDVWLANHRGNPYSKGHMILDSKKSARFWEFSFNEMGRYDIPAAVDYILNLTNKTSLFYVGFSMGTTTFWTFAHWWPEYQSKIISMVAMAPIAIPSGLKCVVNRAFYGIVTTVLRAFNFVHMFEFKAVTKFRGWVVRSPCDQMVFEKPRRICKFVVRIFCAFSYMNEKTLSYKAVIENVDFMMAGSSLQSLFHMIQAGSKREFTMYDYGDQNNMRYYGGMPDPPKYDLRRVTTRVFLLQGGKDELSVRNDTEVLKTKLEKAQVEFLFEKEAKDYNHNDFFFHKEANVKIHKPLVELLKKILKEETFS